MGLMDLASELVHGAVRDSLGSTVTYARGLATVEITATMGVTKRDAIDQDGNVVLFEAVDFILPAEVLILSNEQVRPQLGDTITRRVAFDAGMQDIVHTVLEIPGSDAWRYVDAERRMLRVHTKVSRVEDVGT